MESLYDGTLLDRGGRRIDVEAMNAFLLVMIQSDSIFFCLGFLV